MKKTTKTETFKTLINIDSLIGLIERLIPVKIQLKPIPIKA